MNSLKKCRVFLNKMEDKVPFRFLILPTLSTLCRPGAPVFDPISEDYSSGRDSHAHHSGLFRYCKPLRQYFFWAPKSMAIYGFPAELHERYSDECCSCTGHSWMGWCCVVVWVVATSTRCRVAENRCSLAPSDEAMVGHVEARKSTRSINHLEKRTR